MMVCERCGSAFHSARAAQLELCPRCLLRDDAAAHLVHKPDHSPGDRRRGEKSDGKQRGEGG